MITLKSYIINIKLSIVLLTLIGATVLLAPNPVLAQYNSNPSYLLDKITVASVSSGIPTEILMSVAYKPGTTINVDIKKLIYEAKASGGNSSSLATIDLGNISYIDDSLNWPSAEFTLNEGVLSGTIPSSDVGYLLFPILGQVKDSSPAVFQLNIKFSIKIADVCTPNITAPKLTDAYIQQVKNERKFTPKIVPVTPFDTFSIDFTFSPACPQSNISTFIPKIETVDTGGATIEVVRGSLVKQAGSENRWRWTLNGWSNGIASETAIETLLDSIVKKMTIDTVLKKPTGQELGRKQINEMSACLQLYGETGSGKFPFVFMRDNTTGSLGLSVSELINQSQGVKNAFVEIDPFKKYQDKFSFFVDLYKFNALELTQVANGKLGRGSSVLDAFGAIDNALRGISQCKGGSVYAAYSALTGVFTDNADVASIAVNRSILSWKGASPMIMIHEIGHAFAGLKDEYINTTKNVLPNRFLQSNCTTIPRDRYKGLDNKFYGDLNKTGCVAQGKNKPTESSIMNIHNMSSRFNVVSCGFIVAAIKGGNPKSYYPECSGLDVEDKGVIRSGNVVQPPKPTINPLSPGASNTAPGSPLTIIGSGFSPTGNRVQLTRSGAVSLVNSKNKVNLASVATFVPSPLTQVVPISTYEIVDIPSNGTSITFNIPSGISSATYTLKVAALDSEFSDGILINIYSSPAPAITSFDHPSATAGSWVIATGSGFSTSTTRNTDKVQFSGPQTREFVAGISASRTGDFYIDPTRPNLVKGQYTAFQIPATTTPGTYTVKIANQDSPWSNSLSFTVLPLNNPDGTYAYNPIYAIASQSPLDVEVDHYQEENDSKWTDEGLYVVDIGIFKYLAWTIVRTDSSVFFGKTNTHLVSASSTRVGYRIDGVDAVNYYATNFRFSSTTEATNFLSAYIADIDVVSEGGAYRIQDANFRGIIWRSGADVIFLHANLNSPQGQSFLNQALPVYLGRFPPPSRLLTTSIESDAAPSILQTIVNSVIGAITSVINDIVGFISPPPVVVSAPTVESPSPEIANFQEEPTVTAIQVGPIHKNSLTDGVGGVHLDRPVKVFVSGNYAYVMGYGGTLEIMDISSSTNPVHEGSLAHGVGGAALDTPTSLFVLGDYAYVTSYYDTLEIIDISDKANPVHKGKITHGTGGSVLSYPNSVFVSGNYAYVTSSTGDALEIIDISDKANPVHKGKITHGTGEVLLDNPSDVFVSGNYAYVTVNNNNALEIVDISDPSTPLHAGSIVNGTGGAVLQTPNAVFVLGNHAYISVAGSNALEIVDVSDPRNPTHKGKILDGIDGVSLNYPTDVFILGKYAYLSVANIGNALEVIDVSDPRNPKHKGKLFNGVGGALLDNPMSLFVQDDYIYVASRMSNALEIAYFPNIAVAQSGASGPIRDVIQSSRVDSVEHSSIQASSGIAPIPGFTLSEVPSIHKVSFVLSRAPSKDVLSQINISRLAGFNGEVNLSAEGLDIPSTDFSVDFSPASFAANSSQSVIATITINRSVSAGTKTIRITGRGNSGVPFAFVDIKINARQFIFENF